MRVLLVISVLHLFRCQATSQPLYEVKYKGCFKDWFIRTLKGSYADLGSTATIEACAQMCFLMGYKLIGLQNYSECYCGNSLKSFKKSGCKLPCRGNSTQICGGHWRNSVYKIVEPKVLTTPSSTTSFDVTTKDIIEENREERQKITIGFGVAVPLFIAILIMMIVIFIGKSRNQTKKVSVDNTPKSSEQSEEDGYEKLRKTVIGQNDHVYASAYETVDGATPYSLTHSYCNIPK